MISWDQQVFVAAIKKQLDSLSVEPRFILAERALTLESVGTPWSWEACAFVAPPSGLNFSIHFCCPLRIFFFSRRRKDGLLKRTVLH
jgi:hypothetical protein